MNDKYVYHYSGISYKPTGYAIISEGVITTDAPIINQDRYAEVRDRIRKDVQAAYPECDKVSVTSLTRLSEPEPAANSDLFKALSDAVQAKLLKDLSAAVIDAPFVCLSETGTHGWALLMGLKDTELGDRSHDLIQLMKDAIRSDAYSIDELKTGIDGVRSLLKFLEKEYKNRT